jgi:hypothetical protein
MPVVPEEWNNTILCLIRLGIQICLGCGIHTSLKVRRITSADSGGYTSCVESEGVGLAGTLKRSGTMKEVVPVLSRRCMMASGGSITERTTA